MGTYCIHCGGERNLPPEQSEQPICCGARQDWTGTWEPGSGVRLWVSGHTEPGAPPGPPSQDSLREQTGPGRHFRRTPQARRGRRGVTCPVPWHGSESELCSGLFILESRRFSDLRQACLVFHSDLRAGRSPDRRGPSPHSEAPRAGAALTWRRPVWGLGTGKVRHCVPVARTNSGSFLLACLPHLRTISC